MKVRVKSKQPPKKAEDKVRDKQFRKAAEKAQENVTNGVRFDTYEPMMHVGA